MANPQMGNDRPAGLRHWAGDMGIVGTSTRGPTGAEAPLAAKRRGQRQRPGESRWTTLGILWHGPTREGC